MFKQILHPTDFSDVALRAFEQAAFLAERHAAKLRVLHVVALHDYDPGVVQKGCDLLEQSYAAIEADLTKNVAEMLGTPIKPFKKQDLVTRRSISAPEGILEDAGEIGADLIVMGTHGHSPVRHFFLGSAAERVVRYAPCPVMVLGRKRHVPQRFSRILVPVDYSEICHQAIDLALSLAVEDGAELHLIHVFENVVPPPYFTQGDAFEYDPGLKDRASQALDKFLVQHDTQGVTISKRFFDGRIARQIVDLAEQEAFDLIVMGTNGLTGISHFLLGSVTEKVLRKSDVPVLTVRHSSIS